MEVGGGGGKGRGVWADLLVLVLPGRSIWHTGVCGTGARYRLVIGCDLDSESWLLLVFSPWDFSSACSPRVLLSDASGFVCIAIDIQLYVCVCVCVCGGGGGGRGVCVCVGGGGGACVCMRACVIVVQYNLKNS